MATLALNAANIAPDFHCSAAAHRKRSFAPVEQNSDLDFVSQFSDKKKARSEDYAFSNNCVPIPTPSSTCRKRSLEDLQDSESQYFSAHKKVRSGDHDFRAEWVNMLVSEMMGASSVDDSRSRGARLFDAFKNSTSFGEEAETLERKMEAVAQENGVLKRAVAILDQRQVKYAEMKNGEVRQLKEVVGKYEENVKRLEFDNYRLNMNLEQALRPNAAAVGGRLHPDVF